MPPTTQAEQLKRKKTLIEWLKPTRLLHTTDGKKREYLHLAENRLQLTLGTVIEFNTTERRLIGA